MEGILERSEVSASFAELAWISEEQRQNSKLLEPGSFNACKNITALIIVMLGHSKLDIEILDTGMKTMESDDCKEISRDDGDANSIFAIMQERTRFSCKNG